MADNEKPGSPALSIVRNAIDNPEPAAKIRSSSSSSADDRDDQLELPFLPPGCPVEPLGVNGQLHYYLDEHRQLIALDPQSTARRISSRCSAASRISAISSGRAIPTRPATTASRSSQDGSPKSPRKH
jgi:hypothetical protein